MGSSSMVYHFASSHVTQLSITAALVVFSLVRNKLTPVGVLAAAGTACVHMLHPTSIPFSLLVVFFLSGTIATKVNHVKKANLTQSSAGGSGGEGPRNSSQVLANSATASAFIILGLLKPEYERAATTGLIASYAAAAADTLSSELGILSPTSPFIITRPWQSVPRGTNGGVTIAGLAAGLLGSSIVALTAYLQIPHAEISHASVIALFGLAGSVLDSILGAVCQATVEDKSSGRVVEGENGRRVKVLAGGSRVQKGTDLLNNNGVNFAMTATIGLAAFALVQSSQ